MKRIYNFDAARPPMLSENMLRTEKVRRRLRVQVILIILATAFALGCIGVFASIIAEFAPMAALACVIWLVISLIGSGTIVICYTQKGGATI